jgi:hypothetical protein
MKLNQIKKIYFLTLLSGFMSFPMHSIQQSTGIAIATIASLVSTVGSYKTWHALNKSIYPHVLFIANGLFLSGVSYYLYTITPQGRLKKVRQLLQELSENTLIKYPFDTEETFFTAVYDIHLTDDLPLISAYNNLVDLLPKTHYIFGMISKIAPDICNDSELQRAYSEVDMQSQELFNHISEAIKRIREHKDYLTQLKIYKEFIANEQQFSAAQQMAAAHSQIAQSQQSVAILKWLKALFGIR